ncbi:MAG: diacylglycerol/lipid kinase family protein [Myxococcota bacterium]
MAPHTAKSRLSEPGPAPRRPIEEASSVGVILNPMSGRNRGRGEAIDRLEWIVGDRGEVFRCADPDSLRRAAEDFRRKGLDVLAVSGGDGTNSMVLTAFREVYGDAPLPLLALLRGGTMNTVANGVGAPRGKPEGLLRALVARLRRGERLRTTEVATMDAGGRLGFLFGFGVLHGFLAEYYRRGDPYPTPVTAVTTLSATLGSILVRGRLIRRMSERVVATLTVDGERMPTADYLGVGAGTAPELGLGFKPFAWCRRDLDRFHLVGLTGTAGAVARDLGRLYAGRGLRPRAGFDRTPREVIIEPEADVFPHMVDGDLLEARPPLIVRTGPRVRIIVGSE